MSIKQAAEQFNFASADPHIQHFYLAEKPEVAGVQVKVLLPSQVDLTGDTEIKSKRNFSVWCPPDNHTPEGGSIDNSQLLRT